MITITFVCKMNCVLHVDFLPFNARAGDETIIQPAKVQTIFSPKLTLSTPMVVYGQQYEEIQVSVACANGI